MFKILLVILLVSLTACGNGKSGGKSGGQSITRQEQTAEGNYRAILRPFNNSLSGFLPTGFADFKIVGDKIQVKTLLDDDARVTHIQAIHEGSECPDETHDQNSDGLVDSQEMLMATGAPLLSLDADLNSETEGLGIYPMGGSFTYLEEASLKNLEEDVLKRTGQTLSLARRVVILHGVSAATKLPPTVASLPGKTPASSIPITCGIIQKTR